jgi:hypothetical protein
LASRGISAVQIRGKMACVCQHDFAFGGQNQAKASDETGVSGAQQNAIEAFQCGVRSDLFVSHGAERADGDSAQHRGLQALAADISDGDQDGAVGPGQDLAEVATDFFGGTVGDFGLESAEGWDIDRDQALLNVVCGFQGCGEPLLIVAGARKAIDENGKHAKKRDDAAKLLKVDLEGFVKQEDMGGKDVDGLRDVQIQEHVAKVAANNAQQIDGERKKQEFGVEISAAPSANQIPGEHDSRCCAGEAVSNIAPLEADVGIENQDDGQLREKQQRDGHNGVLPLAWTERIHDEEDERDAGEQVDQDVEIGIEIKAPRLVLGSRIGRVKARFEDEVTSKPKVEALTSKPEEQSGCRAHE